MITSFPTYNPYFENAVSIGFFIISLFSLEDVKKPKKKFKKNEQNRICYIAEAKMWKIPPVYTINYNK